MVIFNGIIDYKIMIEYEPELFEVERATFLRDFGPFKKWEFCHRLKLTYDPPRLEAWDGDKLVKACDFTFVPKIDVEVFVDANLPFALKSNRDEIVRTLKLMLEGPK